MNQILLKALIDLLVGIIERHASDPGWDALSKEEKEAKIHADFVAQSQEGKGKIADFFREHNLPLPE